MRSIRMIPVALAGALMAAFAFSDSSNVQAITRAGVTTQISAAGTASPQTGSFTPSGGDQTYPEFPGQLDADEGPDAYNGIVDRSLSNAGGHGAGAQSGKKAKSNPQVDVSFEGLNFFQQRYARGGNQFSVEPPDQGLCVGHGFVVEAVNDVMNVYSTSGVSLLLDHNVVNGVPTSVNGAVDLNSFYGYAPAINRTTGVRAEFVTDPSCYYDAQTQRFYMVVLTLNTRPNGAFTLVNHLDIAVSNSPDPTSSWTIYKVDVTGDGTSNPGPGNACPCLGDYPHIGADATGFYITTNAYPWNGDGFNGAQIYAFSKWALASGAPAVSVTRIDTFGSVAVASDAGSTQPGFTLWPAQSPGTSSYDLSAGGTEYFLSSNAADEATRPVSGTGGSGTSSQLVAWALTNTSSLATPAPAIMLSNVILAVNQYGVPPKARQPGSGTLATTDTPQGYCINDTTTLLFNGQRGCWRLLFAGQPAHNEVISRPDANDTRMQQVMYANGKLWGSLDTAVSFDAIPANNRAGVAWYILKPAASPGSIAANVALQGTLGVVNTDVTYPAIGVTPSGRGVMAVTLMGNSDNPGAAYASIDALAGVGDVHLAAAGAAQDDGFTSYKAQVGNPPRTRWGDYGAAAVDGNSIWIASEYVAHACDYLHWGGPFFAGGTGDTKPGTCAAFTGAPGPRAALGNWSTRITKLTP